MLIYVFDRVENIMGKGENAGYQHFLLFPQCFEKASIPDTSKGIIVWEWVKSVYVSKAYQKESHILKIHVHCNSELGNNAKLSRAFINQKIHSLCKIRLKRRESAFNLHKYYSILVFFPFQSTLGPIPYLTRFNHCINKLASLK